MIEAARKAVAFSRGKSRADLDADEMLALALVRLLEILGEAAKGLPPEFRDHHPQIPWNPVASTRDRLIHGYFDVDHGIVWEIVTRDLPPLITKLEALLADIEDARS